MIFVKYNQYSPQIMEKSVSNQLSLATASIPGRSPSYLFLYHHGIKLFIINMGLEIFRFIVAMSWRIKSKFPDIDPTD